MQITQESTNRSVFFRLSFFRLLLVAVIAATVLLGVYKLITASGPATLSIYHGHSDRVTAVAWSPNGKRIASASWDKTVQVWDATTGQQVLTYHGHSDGVNALAWSKVFSLSLMGLAG